MADHFMLWRRLDRAGHEAARLSWRDSHWQLAGASVFDHDGLPCRLDYEVTCTADWRTTSGRVVGWIGDTTIAVELVVDETTRWRLNGTDCPAVAGCVDLDLNWSPSTNLLPIRRLSLGSGQEADVRAAWLRFPSFALEPLQQRYRRLDATRYRYESAGGSFVADLDVDEAGFVTRYPGFCEIEPPR